MAAKHLQYDNAGRQAILAGVSTLAKAVKAKKVTYDLARQMEGATEVSCSDFGRAIVAHM